MKYKIIYLLAFVLFAFPNTSHSLDVEHIISDYIIYDDYIDYESSQNISVSLGNYTYSGTSWKGFRKKTNGMVSDAGANAVLITKPYNAMTRNPNWTTLAVSGGNINSIEVSGAEDNGDRENLPEETWTNWVLLVNDQIPTLVNEKQFIKLRITLGSSGYIDQIIIKYQTVMKDHPRLLIDDVVSLRQRCQDDVLPQYQKLMEFNGSHSSESQWQYGVSARIYALKYVLNGNESDKNIAMNELNYALDHYNKGWSLLALGPMAERLILTYDWIWSGLTESERAAIETRIIDFVDYMNDDVYHHPEFNNHIYAEQSSSILAGIALYGGQNHTKAAEYLDIGYNYLFNHWIPATNKLGQGMGGWHESIGYFSGEMGYPLAITMDGMRTATSVNFYQFAGGLRKIPQWYLYSTIPHDKSIIHLADNGKLWWSKDLSSSSSYGKGTRGYLAAMTKNFALLGYDDDYQYGQYLIDELIGELYQSYSGSLYRSGNVYDILWYDPDLSKKNIPDQRLTGYSPILGEVIMREGNDEDDVLAMYHCGDAYGGHAQDDNGHFSIWYKGYLAIDSGYYSGWSSEHLKHYAGRTIAHNTLTIHKPGESFERTDKNDGGQEIRNSPGYYGEPDIENDMCDCELYTGIGFDYINSNFTKSYKEGKVSKVTRQFVFFRPDKFVVFDRVESINTGYKKKYLLHSQNDMAINGEHISFIEGDGKLFSRTLLPQNPEIVKTGGSGQEFTVEGENFPLNDEDARQFAGRFRAEISPPGDNFFDCFLHVMQTTESNATEMADTLLLQSDNAAGAIIGNKVVMFSKDGSELDLVHYGFSLDLGADNLISDLIPAHYYRISDMGIDIYTISANSKGLIYFILDPGEHDITIRILTCHADMDEDNDVDGSDLAKLANDTGLLDLGIFAAEFGRTDCP